MTWTQEPKTAVQLGEQRCQSQGCYGPALEACCVQFGLALVDVPPWIPELPLGGAARAVS